MSGFVFERKALASEPRPREQGVSIIVPSIRDEVSLARALQSVVAQTVDKRLVQVIIIENGPGSSAAKVIADVSAADDADEIDWLWFRSEGPGAARARNVGLAASSREFITFLDDDDWFEPGYLAQLMEAADSSTVAVTGILDYDKSVNGANTLNARAAALPKKPTAISSVPWALGFVASKIIPWALIQDLEFEEGLKSGEDVVFFAQLLSKVHARIQPVKELRGACYCRSVKGASVSRGRSDFHFAVSERLKVISHLRSIETTNRASQDALDSLVRSQVGFIRRYYERAELAEQRRVLDEIARAAIVNFPWSELDRGTPTRLVFSYCFPPDADASANVMAKRIIQEDDLVDVVSNDMSAVRAQDPKFYSVVNRWVNRHEVVRTPSSFSNWAAISNWATAAVRAAESSAYDYHEVYSRALWVASHVAGCLFKLKHPDVNWVAEFSDPLALGADGMLRQGEIGNDRLARKLLGAISAPRNGSPGTLFQVVEEATLILADEVVFTNEAQMEVVLQSYSEDFRAGVLEKATVAGQPVPSRFLYEIGKAHTSAAQKINISYFGAFYPNRGVGTVLDALNKLPASLRKRFQISIFTNSVFESPNIDEVIVRPQLDYLDFLAETQEADVLLVTDTSTAGSFTRNPFLPSKYSDYRGSGTPIWGIVENGSPLSATKLDYACDESVESVNAILLRIARDSELVW